jgi:CHAD domain-containing protein
VKARKVKNVDPDGRLDESLRTILAVRLDELHSFDPTNSEELHDLRIAAKRVRYILEAAEPVFGEGAARGVRAMKQLQDHLGEIHDCDELLPLLDDHVLRLRSEDAAAAADGRALPNRRKYRGLEALRAHTVAERARLLERVPKRWAKVEADLTRFGVPA